MKIKKVDNRIKPIFIFCLPRSGSTLMQRVLMSHSKISSTAEPHFLLPFLYANKKEGSISNYSQTATYKSMLDTIDNLPNKEIEYNKYLKDFSVNIYDALAEKGSIYFVDKTPRYFWIIQEIEKVFPDAKFIFLFRNPVQIYASLLTTYSNNRFYKMYRFNTFINEGFQLLSRGYAQIKHKSYAIQYEEFLSKPEKYIKEIFNYLELEIEKEVLDKFSNQVIRGKSVDPTGIKLYSDINKSPLDKWKSLFNTRYRKKILMNYIQGLEEDSLVVQGYQKKEIANEIKELNLKGRYNTFLDITDFFKAKLVERFKLNLFFDRKMKWTQNQDLN